ncbi:Nif3-like dinuclear metal center hexameric protein [Candidatus Woesearchaeota archaeon]|nr:MAG: Nif3-like dinuclear metal center hexameric protein [Candidatus Woesearchaeota archaeon]
MNLHKIVSFLDKQLKTEEFDDYSLNGLQVESSEEVKKVCFAVDATEHVINEAAKRNCQLLVVHHGLLWGKEKPITGVLGKRIRALIKNGISLYASHLPLDAHPRLGNNAALAKLLGLKDVSAFGSYNGQAIGLKGRFPKAEYLTSLALKLSSKLDADINVFSFGKEKVRTAAVVSGSGSFALEEAARTGVDVLVTGEAKHPAYGEAKDLGMNVVFAGHYATETLGVLNLKDLISKKFKIACDFIDDPSDL